jgi:hypothetical protein
MLLAWNLNGLDWYCCYRDINVLARHVLGPQGSPETEYRVRNEIIIGSRFWGYMMRHTCVYSVSFIKNFAHKQLVHMLVTNIFCILSLPADYPSFIIQW